MLNGNLVHKQNYGYSPFVLDITQLLNDNNEIVVKVDRRRYVDSRWYTGSGIYRDVELILTGDHYSPLWSNIIEAKLEEPDYRLGTINQSVTLCSPETEHSATGRLVTQVIDLQSLKVVNENRTDFTPSASTLVNLSIDVNQPRLWSPDVPNLYRVVSKIYINDIWVDELKVHTGFRSIEFKSESGFYLNGESTKIKGVCFIMTVAWSGLRYLMKSGFVA
ncbi:beta-galactosidase [Vibrio astriarenae]|nr:beta-galactosidase [Vibrio sp. C7]